MAIMGFGGGALIATPLKEYLLRQFYRAPDYLGPESSLQHEITNQAGVQFAMLAGELREIVVLSSRESAVRADHAAAGVYAAGTGSTGVGETFVVLGVIYFLVMLAAALAYRVPAPGWKPAGWTPLDDARSARKMISLRHVAIGEALKTPQFYLLWIVLCFNVTAGIGILSVAKTMMLDIFGNALPAIVTNKFAQTYVLMAGLFNMLGRFFWASLSDHLGRKTTYTIFFVAGIALYLVVPWTAHAASDSQALVGLVSFYFVTMLIFTMYGGGFATIPAYLADLFGSKFVGGIHGRLLTAWSTAGVLGPLAITSLREQAVGQAIGQLARAVDPRQFFEKFKSPIENLDALVAAKTVTIAKLMEIAPAGTVDPTATVYNSTMYLMAGLLGIALIANLLVRPVEPKHYLDE